MRNKGFTLIELLIVVAIIAILAAIAVPNFLEAQTRAKVARSAADIRTIATALETYRIDHNKYPVDGGNKAGNMRWPPSSPATIQEMFGSFRLNNMITTPISYLSTGIYDSFLPAQTPNNLRTLRYFDVKGGYMEHHPASPLPGVYAQYAAVMGDWQALSVGPNKTADSNNAATHPGWLFNMFMPYDATNGTVSRGDIIRSQKAGENYAYPS